MGNWQANAAGCVSAVPSGRCSDGAVTQRLRPDQSVTKLELMRRDFKFVGASSLTHTRMKSSPSTVKAEWGVKYTTFYVLLIYMSSARRLPPLDENKKRRRFAAALLQEKSA